ncbi:MAG: recombination-associated protein RdgC [Verrucomicrobia bacterium]|nr:recombination-associated protein RdgC [Verrucomicrobiota bacterium]
MSFESGSVSLRTFVLPRQLPEDAIERFAARSAPSLEAASDTPSIGWVTGRHLLDTNITESTAHVGSYLRLTLRQTQRKVPSALMKAECQLEQLAALAAAGKQFLSSKEKAEIKRGVQDRLLPAMPPQISAVDTVFRPDETTVFTAALSVKQSDQLAALFLATMGYNMLPLTPETAASERKKVDVTDWRPVSFTPELPDQVMDCFAGRDFLTWLWFVSEARGGVIPLPDGKRLALLIEGPLVFVHEGNGAHETILKKGDPVSSAEAKTALMSGKKLKQAKMTLSTGEEQIWSAMVNADEFTFRSLRLSDVDRLLDPVSQFEERMRLLDEFVGAFFGMYDLFVDQRKDPSLWKGIQADIFEWVKERRARA